MGGAAEYARTRKSTQRKIIQISHAGSSNHRDTGSDEGNAGNEGAREWIQHDENQEIRMREEREQREKEKGA